MFKNVFISEFSSGSWIKKGAAVTSTIDTQTANPSDAEYFFGEYMDFSSNGSRLIVSGMSTNYRDDNSPDSPRPVIYIYL
tara:strand:+ start:167 stop:406 length:240 start_codon:yes stop_codon:yes gene_type:complete